MENKVFIITSASIWFAFKFNKSFLLTVFYFAAEPQEFRNKSFMSHLQNIPYNETILTKKMEEYFYNGLHMTFCRKRDDTLAIVSMKSI